MPPDYTSFVDGLHHVGLYVSSLGEALAFYRDDAIAGCTRSAWGCHARSINAVLAALIAAAAAGKALVDEDCAEKAVAELTREQVRLLVLSSWTRARTASLLTQGYAENRN